MSDSCDYGYLSKWTDKRYITVLLPIVLPLLVLSLFWMVRNKSERADTFARWTQSFINEKWESAYFEPQHLEFDVAKLKASFLHASVFAYEHNIAIGHPKIILSTETGTVVINCVTFQRYPSRLFVEHPTADCFLLADNYVDLLKPVTTTAPSKPR